VDQLAAGRRASAANPAPDVMAAQRRGRQYHPRTVSAPHLVGWIGPSLLLVVGVVLYPLYEVARTSFQHVSITGAVLGPAGLDNYRLLFDSPNIPRVIVNTVLWVVIAVAVTTALALPLGQLLSVDFPGRRLVRAAVIVPWASSVVMTAIGFRWVLNYYYGALNPLLKALHIIHAPIDWLGDGAAARWVMIGVVVFVSLPFTAMAILAGLKSIPEDAIEAAHLDGAGSLRTYWYVVLPQLRGPLVVTVLLNTVWIFNSFPIIYVLNFSNPGYQNDTSTTYMYKISFLTDHNVGEGASMSVINVAVLAIAVALFVRRARLD
jgi:ABC-type sugar transport system permease subunit